MKPLNPGGIRQIGRYRLLASLGQGGMGHVYLAVSPDGRLVALKQVHAGFAQDEGFRSRFRREVETSRMVSGAYTAAVMDADPEAETPWLASVFVAGPSLREAITANGPLPVPSIRYLAAGLASALSEIHRVGLIHRDLKPSNVLLAEDGPRVIDFGIARAAEGEVELTHTGSIVGSPGFMSPEQAEGRAVTPASDVFSLGALLVMAATGRGPFTGTSTPQTLYNVVHSAPDLRSVPPEIRRLAEPCLAKDPASRPTPEQILDFLGPTPASSAPWPTPVHSQIAHQRAEVQAFLAGPVAPMTAQQVSWQQDPWANSTTAKTKNGRSKRVIAACLTLVVLLALGGIAWATDLFGGSANQGGPAASTAPPKPQPLTTANLRLMDPCGLLTEQTLAALGTPARSEPGVWGVCDNAMVDKQGQNLSVTLTLGDVITNDYKPTNAQAGVYPILASPPTDGTCKTFAEVQKEPQVGINLYITYKTGDPCQTGMQLIQTITEAATHNPPQYRPAANSLIAVDPCSLISSEQLAPLIGQPSGPSSESFHSCRWPGSQTTFHVEIGNTSRPNAPSRTDYAPVDFNGVTLYQYKEFLGSCTFSFIQRLTDQDHAETVEFSAVVDETKNLNYQNTCEKVKQAITIIQPKLPKA